ncbi:MAG: D-alanyl-D-alanine carboxypeptidase [Oscillospiraceae bacterium]|nr:D-alanyl-D-alanine carboxypeptidase [Oscillospiraceae bacterium]
MKLKRILAGLLLVVLLTSTATAVPSERVAVDVPFAILMEKETGAIIFEKEADTQVAPASITKIMTALLIIEELEAGRLTLDDMITTSARAASMGGSQIYLEEGEQMTVRDMLKAIMVSSANDASVAMAEHISGTEDAFAARMNERATELGMTHTIFLNSTGLPIGTQENQVTARDVAIMSRALISHDLIKEFSTIWMDSVRGGEFGLSNTNRLIHSYAGATGLKTGFTQTAMYCLAATAERDGVEFIAVVLHGETSDQRFTAAQDLLNYAFANYTLVNVQPEDVLRPLPVELGTADTVQPVLAGHPRLLMDKTAAPHVTQTVEILESVPAPVTAGQHLGTLTVYEGDTVIATIPIVAGDDVGKLNTVQVFGKFLRLLFTGAL